MATVMCVSSRITSRLPTTVGHVVVVQNQSVVSTKRTPWARAAATSAEIRSGRIASSRAVAQAEASSRCPDRQAGGSTVLAGLSPITTTCGVTRRRAGRSSRRRRRPTRRRRRGTACRSWPTTTRSGWCSAIQSIARVAVRRAGEVQVRRRHVDGGHRAAALDQDHEPVAALPGRSAAAARTTARRGSRRTAGSCGRSPATPYSHGCRRGLTPAFTQSRRRTAPSGRGPPRAADRGCSAPPPGPTTTAAPVASMRRARRVDRSAGRAWPGSSASTRSRRSWWHCRSWSWWRRPWWSVPLPRRRPRRPTRSGAGRGDSRRRGRRRTSATARRARRSAHRAAPTASESAGRADSVRAWRTGSSTKRTDAPRAPTARPTSTTRSGQREWTASGPRQDEHRPVPEVQGERVAAEPLQRPAPQHADGAHATVIGAAADTITAIVASTGSEHGRPGPGHRLVEAQAGDHDPGEADPPERRASRRRAGARRRRRRPVRRRRGARPCAPAGGRTPTTGHGREPHRAHEADRGEPSR